jgi:predicted MarR family transcription regulator
MALVGALAASVHTVTGQITNKSLRALVTTLLGAPYTSNRMSYDLRRLRLEGLIERVEGSNAYRITPDGQRFAVFYTKLHNRLLRPLMAADRAPSPPEIRQALATLDRHVTHTIDLARLTPVA